MFSIYKFKDFFNKYINWDYLSLNPNDFALDILEELPEAINFENLSLNNNSRAIDILKKYPDKIHWKNVSKRQENEAIEILRQNYEDFKSGKITFCNVDTYSLCSNPNNKAIDLLLEIIDTYKYNMCIDWVGLFKNPCDKAVDFCMKNLHRPEKIWFHLNTNKRVIKYLLEEPKYIIYNLLCKNTNEVALELIESVIENVEKGVFQKDDPMYFINKLELSENNSNKAIEILKKYPNYISWENLAMNANDMAIDMVSKKLEKEKDYDIINKLYLNPNPKVIEIILKYNPILKDILYLNEGIFEIKTYNYKEIRIRMSMIEEELIASVWNPKRVHLWSEGNPYLDDM